MIEENNEDELNSSLAHIILCCVSGQNLGKWTGKSYVEPGMHGNFFLHGIIGFLHSKGSSSDQRFGSNSSNMEMTNCAWKGGQLIEDFSFFYGLSNKATRYLALPCLLADLHKENKELCAVHLLSGILPFFLTMVGEENKHVGNLVIALSVMSLCNYAMQENCVWGWYTAGASILSYFCCLHTPCQKLTYPSSLALVDYCAAKLLSAHNIAQNNRRRSR